MIWGDMKTRATKFIHRKDIDWDSLQQFACDDISQKLVVQDNEGYAVLTSAVPDPASALYTFALPADYARMRVVKQGAYNLTPTSIAVLTSAEGYKLYAISGRKVWARKGGDLEIVYSTRTQAVTADAETNVLLEYYSPVMLYALLKQGAIQAKDFDAKDQYEAQYLQAVDDANATYLDAAFGAGMAPVTPGGVV